MPSAIAGKVARLARYVDNAGKEHTRHFDRKVDAQKWLKDAMASVVRGDHVAPKVARLTVGEWSDKWARRLLHPAQVHRAAGGGAPEPHRGALRRGASGFGQAVRRPWLDRPAQG